MLCELDDTAIHPSHAWAPLRVLLKVHATFHAASLQASPRKTQLSVDSSKYLWHEISAQGVQISLEYAVVVRNWPLSDTLKALRMLLRKYVYCCWFLTDHALFSALVQYTQRDQHDAITSLHKDPTTVRDFKQMKRKLLPGLILSHSQFYLKPFILPINNPSRTWIQSLESLTGLVICWLEVLGSSDCTAHCQEQTLHGNADTLPQALFTSYPLPGGKEVLVNEDAVVVVILQESADLTVQGVRQHLGQGEDIADIQR